MSLSSDGIYYISSLLKLNQMYKPEDMYLNDFKIKDKNELINYIKYIHRDISLSAEIIENIYSNNFKINEEQKELSGWSKNELLYKFGINSPLYQQTQKLYNNLLTNIINEGKEIKNNGSKNITEDIDMKIEKENIITEDIKERISNINSLCGDFEDALKQYKDMKKNKEIEKKKLEEENKMFIENESKNENEKDKKEKIIVDGVELIVEDEKKCLDKLKKNEMFF